MSIRVNGKAIAGSSVSALKKYQPYNIYKKDDVVFQVSSDKLVYFVSLVDNNGGNSLSNEVYWKKIELEGTGSGSGLSLFDVTEKDYVLTYENTLGFTRLGEYAYKTPSLGVHYGYPEFYEKCLEEYKESTEVVILKDTFNKVGSPTYTSDGIMSGFTTSIYATMPTSFNAAAYNKTWEVVGKFKLNTLNQRNPIYGGTSGTYLMDVCITANNKFAIALSSNGTSYDITGTELLEGNYEVKGNTWYWVKLEFTGEYYQLSYSTDNKTWLSDIKLVTTTPIENTSDKLCIGFRNGTSFTNNEIDLKECYINIDGQRWWTGCNYALKHQSGHIYYDIKEQPYVHQLWAYGIDTEQERILLPISQDRFVVEKKESTASDPSWYTLYSDGWCEQGGTATGVAANAGTTIKLFKPYVSRDFIISNVSAPDSFSNDTTVWCKTAKINNSSFKVQTCYGADVGSSYPVLWSTLGYTNEIKNPITKYMVTGNAQNDIGYIDIVRQSKEGIADIQETKEQSLLELDSMSEQYKEEMSSYKDELVQSIIDEAGNEAEEAKYWADVAALSSSNSLFDVKLADHILEGAEAYGWELQGTYVYKEAALNEHLGYPTFYNKCIEEYTDVNNQIEHIKSNVTLVGSLTNNNGVLRGFSGSNYALIENIPSDVKSFEIVFKVTSGSDVSGYNSVCGQETGNYTTPQFASSQGRISFGFAPTTDSWGDAVTSVELTPNTQYWLKGEWNGTQKIFSCSTNGKDWTVSSVEQNTCVWTTKLAIGIDYDSNHSNKFWTGSIDLNHSYINVNGQRWWTGTESVVVNKNGHRYYDIANKSVIDSKLEADGSAWYYGVDIQNQRILLPRNNYFDQATGLVDEVGLSVKSGLPNINGSFFVSCLQYKSGDAKGGAVTGAFTRSLGSGTTGANWTANGGTYTLNASRSSAVYGRSSTVQPASVKKLLYICVGNTKADTSWITLTEQVNEGIKEIDDTRILSLNEINETRLDSLSQIDENRTDSLIQLDENRETSLQAVSTLTDESTQGLQLLTETSITDINTATVESLNNINLVADERLNEVDIKTQNTVNEINTLCDNTTDELEDLRDQGLGALVNASNALRQTQISNCLLEVPQTVKYTLADKTLTIHKGTIITIPYGTVDLTEDYPVGSTFVHENFKVVDTDYYANKFFVTCELQNDISKTGEVADTSERPVWICLTNNDFTCIVNHTTSETAYEGTGNNANYRPDLNIIELSLSGEHKDYILSFPVVTVVADGTYIYSSVKQVFNSIGYMGSTYWVCKGIKGLAPNEINFDGSLDNTEITTEHIMIANITAYTNNQQPLFISKTSIGWSDYLFIQEQVPNDNYSHWYKPSVNTLYYAGETVGDYNKVTQFLFGYMDRVDGKITGWYIRPAFKAADYNELPFHNVCRMKATTASTASPRCPAVIVENYKSGNSWYRVWSDGWIEQGGYVSVAANKEVAVTLLKTMSDTNYYVNGANCTYFANGRYACSPCCKRTSTSKITLGNIEDTTVSYSWEVKGY